MTTKQQAEKIIKQNRKGEAVEQGPWFCACDVLIIYPVGNDVAASSAELHRFLVSPPARLQLNRIRQFWFTEFFSKLSQQSPSHPEMSKVQGLIIKTNFPISGVNI